ncbi:hypothetical protein OJAV_G00234950 [Oryzias javanicus]|uniref:Uncharacterized protein n=1 Tax=Oryzias javanicus TaxID=123683 RepID=A0A437BZ15_ORYJA|nr:hypothetical protein OJAV_G00234950 [Oryzias javanicus]
MIVCTYKTNRECIVSIIVSETSIQLPEVNAATLTQWYIRRCQAQEKLTLNRTSHDLLLPWQQQKNFPIHFRKDNFSKRDLG